MKGFISIIRYEIHLIDFLEKLLAFLQKHLLYFSGITKISSIKLAEHLKLSVKDRLVQIQSRVFKILCCNLK